MLVIKRKRGESVKIGDDIQVYIMNTDGNQITVGIRAPDDVKILRTELTWKDSPNHKSVKRHGTG